MPTRRAFVASTLAAFASHRLHAQSPASRPLRITVPFPPGGTSDYISRLVGGEYGKLLGQSVVIENKPGAGTVIGVDAVAKGPADGSSLICIANSFCVNHTLIKKLPYDSLKDLRPVALMGQSEHVLATHPGSGIKTVDDLVRAARAKPGSLTYASFGNGTSAHLSGEMLKQKLGIDLVHVPYKGQAPALTDLLGGQVTLMFGNWPEFRSQVQTGKLVSVGMATSERSRHAPELPTLAEQGLKLESNSWFGLLAPAATPDALVAKLNADFNRAMAGANVVESFQKSGIAPLAASIKGFADFIQEEIGRYAEVIRVAGIKVD